MLRIITILSIIMLSCLIFASDVYAITWGYSFDAALKKSKNQGKPIMVDFYTDWCGWCKKLDKDTYSNKNVRSLAEKFICVKINGDKHRNLVSKYNVTGYPSIFFLDSDGKVIKKIVGYVAAPALEPVMANVLKAFKPSRKPTAKKKAARKKRRSKKTSPFELSGIIYDPAVPQAIINGRIVKVGDEVDGAKVIAIKEFSVTLKHNNNTITLSNR